MKNQKLHDALANLHQVRGTARIFVFCRAHGRETFGGTITVVKGEVRNVRHENVTGLKALSQMLTYDCEKITLAKSGFKPEQERRDRDLPVTSTLIQQAFRGKEVLLRQRAVRRTRTAPPPPLQQQATHLMQEMFGPNVTRKISQLAAEFPPDDKPYEFLDKCKEIAAVLYGDDAVRMKFAKLYKDL